MIMTTEEEKKAQENLHRALNNLSGLDYFGFLVLGKSNGNETDFYYNDNVGSYKKIATVMAGILTQCASRFDTTPEEFLKEVEKKFRDLRCGNDE